MESYLEYRKNIRREVSEGHAGVHFRTGSAAGTRHEGGQKALNDYEQSNNFAVLQEESTIEASYLVKLKTELSDYQLEMQLLAAKELEADSGQAGATNDSDQIFESLRSSGSAVSSSPVGWMPNSKLNCSRIDRDRLSKYLLPKHPKMVKLDEQIAHAQKLIDVYSQQNHEQIAAARQALQIKIDSVSQFIAEWESKVARRQQAHRHRRQSQAGCCPQPGVV
jgi:uncharacterized protein involved in exopolysaccharide biosynthesis